MKRVLVVALGLLILSASSFAGTAFGVKGGLNLANASFDPQGDYDTKVKPGVLAGATLELSLNKSNKTTLRLEWLYVQKGWKEEGTILGLDYTGTATVDEFVMAPFAVFRFPSENYSPFLEAGIEVGFNLVAEATAESGGLSATGDLPDWADTNGGINLGAGFAIPSGAGEVILEARVNLGVTNMYTGSGDLTANTNGIQLLVGYNFRVPKQG